MKTKKQKPKIVISEETKKKLDVLGKKNDSYDNIIERLLEENKKKVQIGGKQ